jgi:hypothetical protein
VRGSMLRLTSPSVCPVRPGSGYCGRVVSATESHVRVELEAQYKTITVKKEQLEGGGAAAGAAPGYAPRPWDAGGTPALGGTGCQIGPCCPILCALVGPPGCARQPRGAAGHSAAPTYGCQIGSNLSNCSCQIGPGIS